MGLLFVCFWYYPGSSLVLRLTSISSNKEHKCFDSVNILLGTKENVKSGHGILDLKKWMVFDQLWCNTRGGWGYNALLLWKYTPFYEKEWKKAMNVPMETTTLFINWLIYTAICAKINSLKQKTMLEDHFYFLTVSCHALK